ncbi:hydroxymethylglutaryl-CoA lyase [Lentimicrobium sp.]
MHPIRLTESPRDAQQGLPYVIPAEKRAEYINALLKVGFDVIDFGSFVSPKAIPQMAEQQKVLELVDKSGSETQLMAIVGNERGGEEAARQEKVDILGFPYSTSTTFLQKNINANDEKAIEIIGILIDICQREGKSLRIFMSLAFGNPYGDRHDKELLAQKINLLIEKGIHSITLADTIGQSSADTLAETMNYIIHQFPGLNPGLHLHTRPNEWYGKIDAAYKAGCRSFDGVLNGIGGCPMSGYELVGNLNTLNLINYFEHQNIPHRLAYDKLIEAARIPY